VICGPRSSRATEGIDAAIRRPVGSPGDSLSSDTCRLPASRPAESEALEGLAAPNHGRHPDAQGQPRSTAVANESSMPRSLDGSDPASPDCPACR
jgi:hypothetical protein